MHGERVRIMSEDIEEVKDNLEVKEQKGTTFDKPQIQKLTLNYMRIS
jgi:hypothetical protein